MTILTELGCSWIGRIDITISNNGEMMPIYNAPPNDYLAIVQLLVEKGTYVTDPNKNIWTAVNRASENDHSGISKLMLGKGADITVP